MGKQIPIQPPRVVSQAALANSVQASASGCLVFGLSGYNSKASAQFIQLHDASTTPADTAVPVFNMTVPSLSNFSVDFGLAGMPFVNGVYVCNSSTAPTKTIGSADCQFFVLETLP